MKRLSPFVSKRTRLSSDNAALVFHVEELAERQTRCEDIDRDTFPKSLILLPD